MTNLYLKSCPYCAERPNPQHDKCLGGKVTIKEGLTIVCECTCPGGE